MSITAKSLVVGPLQVNCHIIYNPNIWDEKGEHPTLIFDPGGDAEYITNFLLSQSLKPIAILATHSHYDHILAVNELKMAFQIPFIASKKDNQLLDKMRESAMHFSNIDSGPSPKIDLDISDKQSLIVGEYNIRIIKTPGHTPGSVSFYFKESKLLISGDLIFADGSKGDSSHKYSDKKEMGKSISSILKLPKDVVVLAGHGESFQLGVFGSHY